MYWVSIMHYNRNASVFRTGDPIQLTIGNPAYFPRCLLSLPTFLLFPYNFLRISTQRGDFFWSEC